MPETTREMFVVRPMLESKVTNIRQVHDEPPDEPDIEIRSNCPSLPFRFIETPDRFTPPDGCSNSSVLFNNDQSCYPLLQSCQNPTFWTTLGQSAFGVLVVLQKFFRIAL